MSDLDNLRDRITQIFYQVGNGVLVLNMSPNERNELAQAIIDQLRTDEAIERVARAIHDDECACGDLNNDQYGEDGTLYYLDKARIAINALLGEN